MNDHDDYHEPDLAPTDTLRLEFVRTAARLAAFILDCAQARAKRYPNIITDKDHDASA